MKERFEIKTKDHEEYIIETLEKFKDAMDELAWAGLLDHFGYAELSRMRAQTDNWLFLLKDKHTVDVSEDENGDPKFIEIEEKEHHFPHYIERSEA